MNYRERIYNLVTESPEPKPADVVKAAIAKKGGIEAVKKERSDARKAARRDMKDVLASKAAERRDDVKRGFRTSANVNPDEDEVESDLRDEVGIKTKLGSKLTRRGVK